MRKHLLRNYTELENDTLEALARGSFSAREFRVILAALRLTNGFHLTENRVGVKYLAQVTGLDRRNVWETLERLTARQVIARDSRGVVSIHGPALWSAPDVPPRDNPECPPQGQPPSATLSPRGTTPVSPPGTTPDPYLGGQPLKKTKKTLKKTKEAAKRPRVLDLQGDRELLETLKGTFPNQDIGLALIACDDYWGDRVKAPRKALINWLQKAEQFKKEAGNGSLRRRRQGGGGYVEGRVPSSYQTPEEYWAEQDQRRG